MLVKFATDPPEILRNVSSPEDREATRKAILDLQRQESVLQKPRGDLKVFEHEFLEKFAKAFKILEDQGTPVRTVTLNPLDVPRYFAIVPQSFKPKDPTTLGVTWGAVIRESTLIREGEIELSC